RDDVLQALLAVARLVDDLLAVGLAQLPLLELDGVGAGVDGGVDQLLRDRQVAVVIDADFGDDVARLARADPPRTDVESALSIGHGLPRFPRRPAGVPERLQVAQIAER